MLVSATGGPAGNAEAAGGSTAVFSGTGAGEDDGPAGPAGPAGNDAPAGSGGGGPSGGGPELDGRLAIGVSGLGSIADDMLSCGPWLQESRAKVEEEEAHMFKL